MKQFLLACALGCFSLSAFAQGSGPAAKTRTKAAETKIFLHELMNATYSVLSQDETIKLQKATCTKFEKDLQQYLGLGTSQSHKIRISFINAGGLLKGYSFYNEVYVAGKTTGANVLLAATPGSPDAFIAIKIADDKITQVDLTNLKTGEKTSEQVNEPKYNLPELITKKIQVLLNKNVLSGTEKATQTGFADRPATDPVEDNLKKKHGVLFISNFYEFQTPGGGTGLVYKHYAEKGNYSVYTHYITDIAGKPLVQPFNAPNMPKYGEVYDLTCTTVSDGKTHNLKIPYGASYSGVIIQQLITEGYLK